MKRPDPASADGPRAGDIVIVNGGRAKQIIGFSYGSDRLLVVTQGVASPVVEAPTWDEVEPDDES